MIIPYSQYINIWKVIKFHGSSHHQSQILILGIPFLQFSIQNQNLVEEPIMEIRFVE